MSPVDEKLLGCENSNVTRGLETVRNHLPQAKSPGKIARWWFIPLLMIALHVHRSRVCYSRNGQLLVFNESNTDYINPMPLNPCHVRSNDTIQQSLSGGESPFSHDHNAGASPCSVVGLAQRIPHTTLEERCQRATMHPMACGVCGHVGMRVCVHHKWYAFVDGTGDPHLSIDGGMVPPLLPVKHPA